MKMFLIAESDWKAIQETLYLLAIPGNDVKVLKKAFEDPNRKVSIRISTGEGYQFLKKFGKAFQGPQEIYLTLQETIIGVI